MRQDHQVLAHLPCISMLVEVLEIGQNADLAMIICLTYETSEIQSCQNSCEKFNSIVIFTCFYYFIFKSRIFEVKSMLYEK